MSELCKACGRFIFQNEHKAIVGNSAYCINCEGGEAYCQHKERERAKRERARVKAKARRNAMREVADSLGLTMVRGPVSGKIYFE